ncbi:MAG: hypothetical protein HY718_08245 [Planctomycetes bacterium]|nr:hypothetical protein [Planctomycetota bacterium]
MTYTGRVDKGVVVFDGPVRPPDRVTVRVEELPAAGTNVGEALDRLAGQAKGLPADLAQRHDYYRRERSP